MSLRAEKINHLVFRIKDVISVYLIKSKSDDVYKNIDDLCFYLGNDCRKIMKWRNNLDNTPRFWEIGNFGEWSIVPFVGEYYLITWTHNKDIQAKLFLDFT